MATTRRRVRFDSIGALGDMQYLAASGLWVPVGLTKATGKAPILQSDGTVGWETPGGGGGSVDVKEEGSVVVSAAAALNFIGGGVTAASAGGGVASVTIPADGRVLLASTTLGAPAANVSFTSISNLYADLLLLMLVRGSTAAASTNARLRMNADTGNNYDYTDENRLGTGQGAAVSFIQLGSIIASTGPATTFTTLPVWINRYQVAAAHRSVQCNSFLKFGTAGGNLIMQAAGGNWRNNAAITQLDTFATAGNYDTGSQFFLFAYL